MSETEPDGDLYAALPVRPVRHKIRLADAPAEYIFTGKQHQFLDLFSRTLDKDLALKEAGLRWSQLADNPYILAEMQNIQQAALFRHRANTTVANHHRLMDKFESLLDGAGDARVKQGYAGILGRMSADAMKQAGEMSDDSGAGGVVGVQVNLFLAGRPDVKPSRETVCIDVDGDRGE